MNHGLENAKQVKNRHSQVRIRFLDNIGHEKESQNAKGSGGFSPTPHTSCHRPHESR